MRKAVQSIEKLGFPWKTQDPFIFCAYHEDDYPTGNSNLGPKPSLLTGRNIGNDFVKKDGWRMYHGETVPGFPVHPHKGFETITINKGGLTDHADSLGAAGRFGNGDTQWMTAGKGIQHSEMFPLLNAESNNKLELFQIWINLPKANKFVEPHFKMLWRESIPLVSIKDYNGNSSTIDVIAGLLNNTIPPASPPNSWAADIENDVAIWTIKMSPNAIFEIPATNKKANRSIYYYKGETIEIDKEIILVNNSIKLNASINTLIKNGNETTYILLLQGCPINENVVQHGPFVMNSEAEIQEAFSEYQNTQFGGWPWPRTDQVHDKNKGRFALHADGTLEIKE